MLADHLGQFHISSDARSVETSRTRSRIYRGGLSKYQMTQRDLRLWMLEDQNSDARFTTMFDLYGLPRGFPAFEESRGRPDPYERVAFLEEAFGADIGDRRFVPYLQLHEFEALVLSDPSKLDIEFLRHDGPIRRLTDMSAQFACPELIDDQDPPSRRIIQEIPEYEGRKSSAGPRIAIKIGLPAIRQKCPHFDAWLRQLERLAN